MTPQRVLLRESARPAAQALVAGALAALATGAGRIAWEGGVVPDLGTWFGLVLLAVPATATVLLPAVLAFAAVAPLRAWERQGAWTGLRASGWRGRDLVGAWLVLGLLGGLVTGLGVHWVEPAARAQARRAVATASLELVPGVRLTAGGVELLQIGTSGAILVSGPHWVASAAEGEVAQGVLRLREGRVAVLGTSDPSWLTFESLEQSFVSVGRPDLAALPTSAVAAAARRSERAGRNAEYEWAIWWKRWLHPVAALFLPLALGPLATRPRGPAWIAAAAVGWILAVRTGDGLAPAWGALVSAIFGPSYVILVGLAAWLSWRER